MMVNIAVLGFGVVGSGVVELIDINHDKIARSAGDEIYVKYILDIRDFKDNPYENRFVKDFAQIENDPEVSVVVETIGGARVAYDFTKRSLMAGKSVVTSNKELVSEHGCELLQIAAQHGASYLFEASVGGGVPILRPIISCLSADEIEEVYGIVNGTTNYILSAMIKDGVSFDDALKDAQRKGYAEHDPSADVDGIDTCRKMCILADLSFGKNIAPSSVPTEGISGVDGLDVSFAQKASASIKLIGRTVKLPGGKIISYVAPHVLLKDNLLANVDGVFNGVVVRGNATGETMYYGKGAGKLPTAAAVISDVIETAKCSCERNLISWEMAGDEIVGEVNELCDRWYIRAEIDADEASVTFGDIEVLGSGAQGTAFLTREMSGYECAEKLDGINAYAVYRVLGDAE